MKEVICQSCSMPINKKSLFGTNKDGSINTDYCKYCYKDGEFIDKVNMEEYIQMHIKFASVAGWTEEQMEHHCRAVFPTLKRWKGDN